MLARTDHDFVLSSSKPKRRSQRREPRSWAGTGWAVAKTLFRNPGRTIVCAAGSAFSIGILVNALALQGGPHPAPFFRAPVEVWRPVNAPIPPARPVDLIGREITSLQEAAAGTAPAPAPVRSIPRPTAQTAPVPVPPPRDPIADVLKSSPPAVEPSRTVLAAQRALSKLNYGPIRPDGLLGAGTRQAIERFERDHKLPVTGELAPRTLRELASASGIPQD